MVEITQALLDGCRQTKLAVSADPECSPEVYVDPIKAALADEIERLRAALKPFASAADNYADCPDLHYIDDDATVTVADLRAARVA